MTLKAMICCVNCIGERTFSCLNDERCCLIDNTETSIQDLRRDK
jgi:hypothetical protein